MSGAKKEKASLFSMPQASVFRTNELQRSQQSLVSGVSFPKQVSRPPAPLTGLCWFGLGSPGCRRCAHRLEKQAGTLKKRVFGKGRLGWGVEETCWLTLAALIAAHSRWISPCIYFKLTTPTPCPPIHTHLFWVECDSPRCPRLIMLSGIALWWLNLLTYLLELGSNAEGGGKWKQYFSQGGDKAPLLLL